MTQDAMMDTSSVASSLTSHALTEPSTSTSTTDVLPAAGAVDGRVPSLSVTRKVKSTKSPTIRVRTPQVAETSKSRHTSAAGVSFPSIPSPTTTTCTTDSSDHTTTALGQKKLKTKSPTIRVYATGGQFKGTENKAKQDAKLVSSSSR